MCSSLPTPGSDDAADAANAPRPRRTSILVSAKIWTGDPAQPRGRGARRARREDRGRRDRTRRSRSSRGRRRRSSTAKWRRVVPGLIDCHTHMSMGGLDLLAMDLRKTKDPAEFTSIVAAYAKKQPPGVWLTDGAWDHEQWTPVAPADEGRPRSRDRRPSDVPLAAGRAHDGLQQPRAEGSAASRATRRIPSGGVIVKDEKGEPTGVLKDTAMDLVWKQRPDRTLQEIVAGLRAANKHAAENGVTSVQDLAGGPLDVLGWDALRLNGELTVRVNYRPLLSTWPKPLETKKSITERRVAPDRRRQGVHGRRARRRDRPDVRAVRRRPRQQRRRDARGRGHGGAHRGGRRRGLPGRGPRDRRQGERADPRHLRARREEERPEGPPLPRRARAAPARRRTSRASRSSA